MALSQAPPALNVFTFLPVVCEASLEQTGFIPGSPISDSHMNLKNSPKHQEGNRPATSANTAHILLSGEKLRATSPSPAPFLVFYSWTHGNRSVCWGAFSRRVNRFSFLFVFKHGSSHPLPLPLCRRPPGRAEAHPRDRTTNNAEGRRGREQRALQPYEKLVLEKRVNPKAVRD